MGSVPRQQQSGACCGSTDLGFSHTFDLRVACKVPEEKETRVDIFTAGPFGKPASRWFSANQHRTRSGDYSRAPKKRAETTHNMTTPAVHDKLAFIKAIRFATSGMSALRLGSLFRVERNANSTSRLRGATFLTHPSRGKGNHIQTVISLTTGFCQPCYPSCMVLGYHFAQRRHTPRIRCPWLVALTQGFQKGVAESWGNWLAI